MGVCLQRSSPSCCLPQGWAGQVVAEVGWMPCGKGCDGCGAALPPLGWEGLVPCPVGLAFAGASQSASRCNLPTDLGCFLPAAAVSPVWLWRHLLRVLNLSSQGKLGSSQCLLLLAGGCVSSGLARIKSGAFRAGDSHRPCCVQGWWHSLYGSRVDVRDVKRTCGR